MKSLETVGLEGLSLRALATASGVSKSAPYRHFADKGELLVALAATGYGEIAAALEASLHDSEGFPARDGLLALADAYVAFALLRPALYRLMFSRLGYSLHSEACKLNAERALQALVGAVARAQEEGWKTASDTKSLAMGIWAEVHGWSLLLIDDLVPTDQGFEGRNWKESLRAFIADA